MTRIKRTDFSAELTVHDGLSQQERGSPALAPGYFDVHEMPFTVLMSQAVAFSRLVSFYNSRNHRDGDWSAFFTRDETIVMADMLASDLTQIGAGFETALAGVGGMPQRYLEDVSLRADARHPQHMSAFLLATTIDGWRRSLTDAQSREGVELRHLLENVIEGLTGEFELFKQMVVTAKKSAAGVNTIFATQFSNFWFGGGNGIRAAGTPDQTTIFSLRSNFYSFVKAIEMIQAGAARLLQASMENQAHDPAVGMLIAFARQFQSVQKRINRFTENHRDFYYDQVLMVQPRGLTPDSAILVLRPSVAGSEVWIPAGTEFLAGLDEKKRSIIYTSDTDLLLNDLVVSELHTLYLDRDALNFPENKFLQEIDHKKRQLATAAYIATIAANPAADLGIAGKMQAMPLLGAPKESISKNVQTGARLGIALASRALFLKEGQRSISVSLQFDASGGYTLDEQLRKLTTLLKQTRERGSNSVESEAETFFRVFQDMFAISLTIATGWYDLPEYLPSCSSVEKSIKPNCLVLKFSLPPDCPAIVAYSAKVHGEDYGTELPVLRCLISHNNYIFGYEFMSQLALRDIRIDVDVHGCRDLMLYNQIGQLSPLSPFAPFGPIPALGSYLVVGSSEIAIKHLTSFDLDIEWGNLPLDLGGFKSYYQAYDDDIENVDFQARISLLINGKWNPPDSTGIAPVNLFDTNPEDDSVESEVNLSCDPIIHYYKPLDMPKPGVTLTYTPSSRGGFFKFTLSAPKMAFGHQEYPMSLSRVLTANARQKSQQMMQPIPNPPYTPTIASIEMHYSAFSRIEPVKNGQIGNVRTAEQLIQLHPLGWENMIANEYRPVYLFPNYATSGNLFIGLDGSKVDGIVTLFFHLAEDSLPMEPMTGRAPEWFYLRDNRWVPLSVKQVVADSTEGFMTSGVIMLDLPDDVSKGNTILPGNLFWLRLSAEYDLEKFCSVNSIYAQALKVNWHFDAAAADNAQANMPHSLPAGTISKSRQTIPGVTKIAQIIASSGGRLAETREQTRVRIGERLRHKNRALTATDYELLILEQFPSIYRVKCFANMVQEHDRDKRIRPGNLLIVPVPKVPDGGSASQMPMLSGHLINEIREFVIALAPQFATVKVDNPAYEQIQVRCTVKLKKGLRGGRYASMLNEAVSDFLSPWAPGGYQAHFGWCVRQHDLESFIQDQDYVDDVTGFSMLRVAPDGNNQFMLSDTAAGTGTTDATDAANAAGKSTSISPKYPWSIAVPLKHHAIDTTDDFSPIRPVAAGLDELEIGATFIVSSGI